MWQLRTSRRIEPAARSGTAPREAGLNVLLITIDTLRADAIGAYGQHDAGTPSIDRLSAAGVRFANAHAHNVVTLPSHANILSGRLPPDHGVRDNAGFRFPGNLETLATLLKAQGYRTGAFVSAFPLDSRFGLARGFDVYDDRFADAARPAFLVQERAGTEAVSSARRWLDDQGANRWFCWVHLYEPHFPYTPPEYGASRGPRSAYQGEVAAADAALAPLLEPILASGRDSRTLVVLTADHGEALGDHGEATHGVFAYEAVLRVPLVVHQPRLFAPKVIDAPARHVDLLPTVLDAVALAVPAGLAGRSLIPSMIDAGDRTANQDEPTYFEALSASLNRGWAPLDGVVHGRSKYIELPIPELYDLSADPAEAHNLAPAQPKRLDEMRALLRAMRGSRASRPAPETNETRARLRSLGYIASAGPPTRIRYSEDDDPKRLIELDAELQAIVGLYVDGDLAGAIARCRELVRRQPGMPLALLQLAQLERESGNLQGGVDALRRALTLAPDNTEIVALLGAYLTQSGRALEAVRLLEPFMRREQPDVEIVTAGAVALTRTGRPREALEALARAGAEDPSNARLLLETGTIHLITDRRAAAREAFEAALAINPALARAHSSLGVLDIEQGRTADALAHWKAATALDAREFDTILAVGLSLTRTKRIAEGRTALEFFVANAPASRYASDIARVRAVLAATR